MQIKERVRNRKLLIGVLLLIIIFVSGYFFIWAGQIEQLHELRFEKETLAQQIEQGENASQKTKELEADILELEKELDSVNNQYFHADPVSSPLKVVHILEKYCIVTLVEPGNSEKKKYYTIRPLKVAVEGDYSGLVQAIKELEANKTAVNLRKIKIIQKAFPGDPLQQTSEILKAELQLDLMEIEGKALEATEETPKPNNRRNDPFSPF